MKEFEWDEKKREVNLIKHGLDFVRAVDVFTDARRVESESIRRGEKRYQTIGAIENDVIIFVVYTGRGDKKRIISARRASKRERKEYSIDSEVKNERQN